MSEVRVDEAALASEADQVAQQFAPVADSQAGADGAPAPADPPGPTTEELLKGYHMIGVAVVGRAGAALAPAWAITPAETNSVAQALAGAAVLWFPDAPIPPKYLALALVAEAVFSIIEARRDPATGQLKPRRVEQRPKDAGAPAKAA